MSTVDLRLVGDVDQVDELVAQLEAHSTIVRVSRPYSVRGRDDQVRIYLNLRRSETGEAAQ